MCVSLFLASRVAPDARWLTAHRMHVTARVCFLSQLLLLAPLPIILLIYVEAESVRWYYSGFALPSLIMVTIVMPLWSKQPYGMPVHRVRVIQS